MCGTRKTNECAIQYINVNDRYERTFIMAILNETHALAKAFQDVTLDYFKVISTYWYYTYFQLPAWSTHSNTTNTNDMAWRYSGADRFARILNKENQDKTQEWNKQIGMVSEWSKTVSKLKARFYLRRQNHGSKTMANLEEKCSALSNVSKSYNMGIKKYFKITRPSY